VTGRGHRAALPEGSHTRPEYLVEDGQGGLVVRHHDRHGRVREYDFASLPVPAEMQRSLAAVFAGRCVPARWASHSTSQSEWRYVKLFARFLAGQQRTPRDPGELTVRLVREWRETVLRDGDYHAFTRIASLLRDDPRLQAGPVADELARRRKAVSAKVQSYSDAEFDQVRMAARRTFRAALQRINDNARHLEQWRDGAFANESRNWLIGEGLDVMTRTGDLPRYAVNDGSRVIKKKYRRAFGAYASAATWQRLFLTREEAAALGVLLMAEFGWNLSVINSISVPLASPDPGEDGRPTYRIALDKPRRGAGRHHETRNVTDHGADSPGRLITQALQATRFARAIVEEQAPGTDRLIVWRTRAGRQVGYEGHPPVGFFCFGIDPLAASKWASDSGLKGSPFRRGRRTVVALDQRQPTQHSQDSHDRYYVLPDKRVQAGAVEVIAAGAEDAADRARKAVLNAQVRHQRAPGDAETATADCSAPGDSPWPSPDGGCGASFLWCLACPCARVHPGHHPRLAHLHEALASLRSVLPTAAWAADWRDAHDRLEDLSERVGDGPWNQALARVTDTDREIVAHLLQGALDA
jgi:hypothetical protein